MTATAAPHPDYMRQRRYLQRLSREMEDIGNIPPVGSNPAAPVKKLNPSWRLFAPLWAALGVAFHGNGSHVAEFNSGMAATPPPRRRRKFKGWQRQLRDGGRRK